MEHHQGGLQAELAPAKVEQVFEWRSQQIRSDVDEAILNRDALFDKLGEPLGV